MARIALAVNGELTGVALSDSVLLFDGAAPADPAVLQPSREDEAADASGKPIIRSDKSSVESQQALVSIAFSNDGEFLVTIDGDKTVRVWNVASKECVASHRLPKKLSSLTVAPLQGGAVTEVALVGDKTGDVWALPLPGLGQATLMLGHTASIVTGLALVGPPGGGCLVASADRDEKVRLSCWPETSLVSNFCLGHTEYVSGIASHGERVVSVSGDGTLRAWAASSGCETGRHACLATPVALAVSGAGLVAVASAGTGEVDLLLLDAAGSLDTQVVKEPLLSSGTPLVSRRGKLDSLPCAAGAETLGNFVCVCACSQQEKVTFPEPPCALAFSGAGGLLALCPSPPYLFQWSAGSAVSSSGHGDRVAAAVAARGLKILSPLALLDHELVDKEGREEGEGSEEKPEKPGKDYREGDSELRKRPVSNPHYAAPNSTKRKTGAKAEVVPALEGSAVGAP